MSTDFIPLGSESQGSIVDPVLFLNSSASAADLLDAAERRTGAVRELLDALSDCQLDEHQPDALSKVARVAALLLSDAEDLQGAARRKMARDRHQLHSNRPSARKLEPVAPSGTN